jgi:ankyrin repeat protein
MYAAAGGHTDIIRLLVEVGHADINALVRADPDLVARVKARILKNESASTESDAEQMEEDIEHADGGTALTVSSEIGKFNSVVTLVELGANVSIVCEDNMTAVLYSFSSGFPNITEFLIEHGGNPNDVYIDSEV